MSIALWVVNRRGQVDGSPPFVSRDCLDQPKPHHDLALNAGDDPVKCGRKAPPSLLTKQKPPHLCCRHFRICCFNTILWPWSLNQTESLKVSILATHLWSIYEMCPTEVFTHVGSLPSSLSLSSMQWWLFHLFTLCKFEPQVILAIVQRSPPSHINSEQYKTRPPLADPPGGHPGLKLFCKHRYWYWNVGSGFETFLQNIDFDIEMLDPGPPSLHRGHQPPPGLGLWPDLTIAQFDRSWSYLKSHKPQFEENLSEIR